jgi:hypothetical protein
LSKNSEISLAQKENTAIYVHGFNPKIWYIIIMGCLTGPYPKPALIAVPSPIHKSLKFPFGMWRVVVMLKHDVGIMD